MGAPSPVGITFQSPLTWPWSFQRHCKSHPIKRSNHELRSEKQDQEKQGHPSSSQKAPASLPDAVQGTCYLLLLNVIEFHLEASAGKQHGPAPSNKSTEERKWRQIQVKFTINLLSVLVPKKHVQSMRYPALGHSVSSSACLRLGLLSGRVHAWHVPDPVQSPALHTHKIHILITVFI
jgi:hypothetical protein